MDTAAALHTVAEPDQRPAKFLSVAPETPQTDCGRWSAAGEEIRLIDDWYRVVDWYRSKD